MEDDTRQKQIATPESLAQPSSILIRGHLMISLTIDGKERICLSQLSNSLLTNFSYNEIHNRRVALGINCLQCTPSQLELLRSAGAMPVSSRRCGMITRREAERLVRSFLDKTRPPSLPEKFAFDVQHRCGYGCRGTFSPARYNSSRAKCIQCALCGTFFSPNKFIFHSHKTATSSVFLQAGNVNFNSWRRHISLVNPSNEDQLANAWEDVKSIFNSGKRKRGSSNARGNFYDDEEEGDDEDDQEMEEDENKVLFATQKNEEQEKNSVNTHLNASLLNFMNPFYANPLHMMRFFPDLFQNVCNQRQTQTVVRSNLDSSEDVLQLAVSSSCSSSTSSASSASSEIKKKTFFSIIDHLKKN